MTNPRLLGGLALSMVLLAGATPVSAQEDDANQETPQDRTGESDTKVNAPAPAKPAHVTVYSRLRGAEVRIDDVLVGKTPLAEPVTVTPGKHEIEILRPGYMTLRRTLDLADGAYSTVAFDPDEDPSGDAPRGRLRLAPATGDLAISIDGHSRGRYSDPIELPAGPHVVRIERFGYDPIEQLTDVSEGQETVVPVSLQPTSEAHAAASARTGRYRSWAIAALATGAVVVGGSTGLVIWSMSKLSSAEDKLTAVQTDPSGPCRPGGSSDQQKLCAQSTADAQSDVDRYRNLRLGSFIGVGVGAALVATGITLLVIAPPAEPAGGGGTRSSAILPQVFAGPDGAGLLVRGRF